MCRGGGASRLGKISSRATSSSELLGEVGDLLAIALLGRVSALAMSTSGAWRIVHLAGSG